MVKLPSFDQVVDLKVGQGATFEAWLYHFLTENNIEYLLNPSLVSSPEQLRFMVALNEEQVYLPCDDNLFFRIYNKDDPKALAKEYLNAWRFVVSLVQAYNMSKEDSRRILGLCRYRFRSFFNEGMILPSRMIKRLVSIVLTQRGDPDPFKVKKQLANARAAALLADKDFQTMLYACPQEGATCATMPDLRWKLDITEMGRLMLLSTWKKLWEKGIPLPEVQTRVMEAEKLCKPLREVFAQGEKERKKIMFIPDVAGGFMFDAALLLSLLRQGYQVILVVKDAFYFNSPNMWDVESDPLMREALDKAHVVTDEHVTKNALLQLLREHGFIIISDGTTEQLNLYRTSVTFARAWKECDTIVCKGRRNKQVFLGSSHKFTRDILCYWEDDDGEFHMEFKPRADWVHKFSEKDILSQAREIIAEMHQAKMSGKTIMFYSAIIGSIPGQTKVAIQLVNTFVTHLRSRLDNTFIINPAEHFVEGMDGDDLMYMWEYVQRSGLLDVWRFQTVEDIEASFGLMDSKVPSMWSGKDSTFSTGCTKEMRIALDVQRQQPELQLIGPASEKFFRRRDYGVGKYFDATLKG